MVSDLSVIGPPSALAVRPFLVGRMARVEERVPWLRKVSIEVRSAESIESKFWHSRREKRR